VIHARREIQVWVLAYRGIKCIKAKPKAQEAARSGEGLQLGLPIQTDGFLVKVLVPASFHSF
jgi:hypothetical protein